MSFYIEHLLIASNQRNVIIDRLFPWHFNTHESMAYSFESCYGNNIPDFIIEYNIIILLDFSKL